MNLPNKLTLSRIILSFIFIFLLFSEFAYAKSLALFTFILASVTDFYDGRIARKQNLITNFGKLMDPIADKILVLSAFIGFVELELIPSWIVIIIISREVLITSLRLFAANSGLVLSAQNLGKHKTVSQMASILIILTFLFFKDLSTNLFFFWNIEIERWLKDIIFIVMLIVVSLTLASGILYLWKNRFIFTQLERKPPPPLG